MRFTIQKEDLLYAVSAVERATSGKNTLPVLSGIMISAKNGVVSFRATDLELAIECLVPAEIELEGDIVAPGRKFSALARLLPSGEIIISREQNGQIRVDYEGSHVYVPCLPPEEFPVLPEREGAVKGAIPVRLFRRMVRQVSIAAAQEEVRPVFTGILTELKQDNITMVSTDTHRLARARAPWSCDGELALNIPARAMQEVARQAVNEDDSIMIMAGQSQVYFCYANLTFTSRVIMGQYPDYNQVIPNESLYTCDAVIKRQRFMESLERAALISQESGRGKGSIIQMDLEDHELKISAQVPDEGAISEQLPAVLSGANLSINFNARYLLDVLKVMEEQNIIMHFTGPTTSGVIVPEAEGEGTESENYLYLLLPVRVSR